MKRFGDARVAALFKAYPPGMRARLMTLRELVFTTVRIDRLPNRELAHCIALALTHHSRKKSHRSG